MNYSLNNKILLLVPAVISFLITLILLFKFTFPISWDVYYHIHMADLYMRNGLVFWDFETVAPIGRLILYPPLFHLSLAFLSTVTGISLINLTRFLQPFFSFFLIFTITFSGYKLFDLKIGIISGFLGMFCFVTFNRSVICTPATISMSLFLLTCIFFYMGFNENKLSMILLSGVFFALICNLHMATMLLTLGVLGLYSFIQFLRHKINFKYLLYFILISSIIGLPWWIYVYLKYTFCFISVSGSLLYLPVFFYKYYGLVPSLLALIGYYVLYRNKSEKSLFLIIWTICLLLFSQITFFGVKTVSIRILEVVSYPLILISALGFMYIYNNIKSSKIKSLLVIFLILFSFLSALMYVDSYSPDILSNNDQNSTIFSKSLHLIIDPVGTIFEPSIISLRFGNSLLAHDRYEVMEWFVNNNDKSIMVSEDSILDTLIVSTSRTPVIYGGFTESIPNYVVDPTHIIQNHSTTYELKSLHIGYIVLRQNTSIPIYAQLVYNNTNYKICIIKNQYR